MAKENYYFPLYYKRLLTSTIGWKDEEFGAYMRLLINQFDNNNSIPNDLEELALIAPSVKKNWKRLSKKFKEDETGNLYNEVMREVYNDSQKLKERNQLNGKLGGRPKKPNGYENENPNETQKKPNGLVSETQTKPILITNNKELITNTEALNYKDQSNVVAENGSNIPPPASTTTDFFDNEKQSKLFEWFRRACMWKAEKIQYEIGKFMNKYPNVPLNQCGPLVNSWIAHDKGEEIEEIAGEGAKKMVL